MNKRSNQKPITIKEYTKNYKFPERNKISQEDDYIHKTQSIFLSRMLKNRKIKIPDNEDINKTIENVFHKEENRIRIMNILKRRNHKISYTSERLSISRTNDKSHDPFSNDRNKSFDYHTPIKKYNKLNLFTKNHLTRAVTPLVNNRNRKNNIKNENNKKSNINNITQEKEKEKNKSNLDVYSIKKKKDKKNEIIIHNGHIKAETEKIKYNNNKNKKKDDKNKKNIGKLKTVRNSVKAEKKNDKNLKIEKLKGIFYKNVEKKISKNINDLKIEKLKEIFYENIEKENIKNINDLSIEKLKEIYYENIEKENIKNFNDLSMEKLNDIYYKNCKETKSKNNSVNNYIQAKIEDILIKGKQMKNMDYTGFIIIKKNSGKTEEEIILDKDEDKIKEIFLNILNEISEEENEFITKNEIDLMNLIKEENNIKNKKIKEQEILIQENQKSYINLKNELDILILENKNLKERIGLLEEKEEELKILNKSFSEYKSKKIEEIQNLDNKIKEYEIELNKIKNEKNKKREYNIEKLNIFFEKKNKMKEFKIGGFEIFIEKKNKIKEFKFEKSERPKEKNIINKNEININNRIEEKAKKEVDEKISRALNRIRKKKLAENNNEQNTKNNSTIKKSDKINQIRKMLEQKITGGKNESEISNSKEVKTNETKEINFLNLIDGKPLNKNKKRPTLKINFEDES